MQLICVLLLLDYFLVTYVNSGSPSRVDKVIKSNGRLSRVTWLLHENEHDSIENRIFDEDDNTNEKIDKKHYKKRKYNVKVQHKRKGTFFQDKPKNSALVANSKNIMMPKISHTNNLEEPDPPLPKNDTKVNKIKPKMKTSSNITKHLKPVPKVSDAKRKSIPNNNVIEPDSVYKDLVKDIKEKSKKTMTKDNVVVINEVPRGYGKKKNEIRKNYLTKMQNDITGKEERKTHLHSKMDPTKNIQRNKLLSTKKRQNMLIRMGLNFESLANPPKPMKVKVNEVHENDNTDIADELAKKVRVLCWVMTHPSNHNKTCKPIKDTWGKRCNKLLFMSTEYDPQIPTVKLKVPEGREYLWLKAKAAFTYVYINYHEQYDWFVRADDDSFLVVENLRYLLADFNPQEPMYFGCRFKHFSPQGFMSGGASIVLSNSALGRFVDAVTGESDICKGSIDDDLGTDDVNLGYMFGGSGIVLSRGALAVASKAMASKKCNKTLDGSLDDYELGMCLSRIGVKAMDSRDVAHKGRFLVFMPQDHVSPTKLTSSKAFWYWKYVYYPTEIGEGCCSDYAISFHYVTPDDMYALDYLIYRIRPFGIEPGNGPLPQILRTSQKKFYNNRKIKTKKVTTTTIKASDTTTDSVYEDSTNNVTQNAEVNVELTTDYYEEDNDTTEASSSKMTRFSFYEQNDVTSVTVTAERNKLVNEEDISKNKVKLEPTKATIINVDTENSADKYTTAKIIEFEEVPNDGTEKLYVKDQ